MLSILKKKNVRLVMQTEGKKNFLLIELADEYSHDYYKLEYLKGKLQSSFPEYKIEFRNTEFGNYKQ